jgi:hypothetical protein
MMQHSCPGLSPVKRSGFMVMTLRNATILPMEKTKLTETEKGETVEDQSQDHAHHFL